MKSTRVLSITTLALALATLPARLQATPQQEITPPAAPAISNPQAPGDASSIGAASISTRRRSSRRTSPPYSGWQVGGGQRPDADHASPLEQPHRHRDVGYFSDSACRRRESRRNRQLDPLGWHGTFAVAGRRRGPRHLELRSALERSYSQVDVQVNGGRVFLTGNVPDPHAAEDVMKMATTYSPQVVNSLTVAVPRERQVLLEVKIAEVDRSRLTNFGINVFSTGATNTIGSVTTGQFSPPTITGTVPASSTSSTPDNSRHTEHIEQRHPVYFYRSLECLPVSPRHQPGRDD